MLSLLSGSWAENTTFSGEPEAERNSTKRQGDNLCSEDQIRCRDGSFCIPLSKVCDYTTDCKDGTDEESHFCAFYLNSYYHWRGDCESPKILCTKFGVTSCLTPTEYCQQELPCTGSFDWRVCRILQSGRLSSLRDFPRGEGPSPSNVDASEHLGMEFLANAPLTLYDEDCPQLYTKVGDECLSFLHPVNVTWGEARAFCQTIGGDLMTFRDLDHYSRVRTHLKHSMQTQDFWIGGRYLTRDENKGWRWLSGDSMPAGFPMWAIRYEPECQKRSVTSLLTNRTREVEDGVCYHYNQAPRLVTTSYNREREPLCVAITYQYHYSYSDEDCLLRKSPLCVLNQST